MSESKDVVFINATNNGGYSPPISLCYLQAVLEPKYATELFDAGWYPLGKEDAEELAMVISKVNPKIVGISSVDTELDVAIEFSKKLKDKEKDIVVCMGGYGPTFQPERCLSEGNCDFVVRGEAETTIGEFFPRIIAGNYYAFKKSKGVSYFEGERVISNPDNDIVHDLDSLPFPLRRDIEQKDYLIPENQIIDPGYNGIYNVPLMSSRGCSWAKCKFCNGVKFLGGDAYRVRSNESMIKELEEVEEVHGPCVVQDYSACFLGGRPKQMGKFLGLFSKNFENAYLGFMIRPDSLLASHKSIEKNLGSIYNIGIGIENFSDSFLKRNEKGVSSEINKKAIRVMEDLRKKRGSKGIYYPTFYTLFTIDCDLETTIDEFMEHYKTIKDLNILEVWEPNVMKYFPFISQDQQEEIWKNRALSEETLYLRELVLHAENLNNPEMSIEATNFQEDKLKERAERLRQFFDHLLDFSESSSVD